MRGLKIQRWHLLCAQRWLEDVSAVLLDGGATFEGMSLSSCLISTASEASYGRISFARHSLCCLKYHMP